MRIAFVQHAAFEGPAAMSTWAAARGVSPSVARLLANEPLPALETFDLLVLLGGPMSVNDEARFGWLAPEKQFVCHAVGQGKHVLGLCLGAQLIAGSFGARVYAARECEIGWFPVQRTAQPAAHAALASLPPDFIALHWHGETFDLSEGAAWLARTERCMHPAFCLGDRTLGLQFHLESTPESAASLIRNCPDDLVPGPGVQDPRTILEARGHFRESNGLMERLLDRFVAGPSLLNGSPGAERLSADPPTPDQAGATPV